MNDIKQGGSSTPQKPKGHVDFKSAFYFQTPMWVAEAPMFLKNAIKVTDKYIKKADKLLKDKLKNEPKWKKDIGTFGLSKHSESFSNDPKIKELVQFIGQRSYEFLDWQGFNLQNHSVHFTEFWVQEFSEKGGGHHSTHTHWNQHVSGFYFLKCNEKTSYPLFHDPRPGAVMTKLPLKSESEITMGTSQVHYKPQPGTMIMFPGYVPHEYAVDAGLEPFRFIHWNIKVVETAISKERSHKNELQKNKYVVIKEAVPKLITEFVYNYFLLKRQVARTLFDSRYISQFEEGWGVWSDKQIPNTYSHFADVAMETLLLRCLPIMEKKTGLKLYPTYSYARIYKPGDILHRHKDRFSCEISTTLNLGGDPWPIHLEPKKNIGVADGKKITNVSNNKGILVNLKPGDMLVYRGMELEHWREEFQGDNCAQVFLHYNDQKSSDADKNIYDTRPHLGLPSWFKK